MVQRDRPASSLATALRAFQRARILPQRRLRLPSHGPELARESHKPLTRLAAEHVFSRVAGAAPVGGNALRLLKDGIENYGAWLDAIAQARQTIHLENYIFTSDATGRRFRDALVAKAREGVAIRVLYDWLGCLTKTRPRFFNPLRQAGVEVRCFNTPRLDSPFGWLSRNHRKTLSIDGKLGFVAGLCIGDVWLGDPDRGIAAWRDTGAELRGPAVADLEAAFAQSWAYAGGEPIPRLTSSDLLGPQGDVSLRVIGSKPNTMGLYRFDQLIAALARERLWLTDAYFVGTTAYVQTLIDAAEDGVDVRLLVPGSSDVPVAKALSRAGYRALLEHGVRVFEWNGPMLHAKTAVADGRWARIGSTNLNLASWAGNWELDIAIEDASFAQQMEAMFEHDLEGATEIVLEASRVHSAAPRARPRRGSPGRLAAGAAGLGSVVGAALINRRALGPAEAKVMATGGALLLATAGLAVFFPRVLTIPLALLAAWIALTLLVRAFRLRVGRGPTSENS
jgi:cardiolipin synthase